VLRDLQRVLLAACLQPDPAAFLRETLARGDHGLSADEQAMLRAPGADGLRLSHVLVMKLRLERLLRGDARAAAAARADPVAFMARFARYTATVPPTAVFPSEEAALFAAFAARDGG
jgi:hypothetical protein